MSKSKMNWCSLGILYSVLMFSGCTQNVDQNIDVGSISTQESSEDTAEVSIEAELPEDVEIKQTNSQFLTEEQLKERRAEDRNRILSIFSSCKNNDFASLSNAEYFDAVVFGTEGLSTTEMPDEIVYWYSNGKKREVWHEITMNTEVSSLADYIQYIIDYLSKYGNKILKTDDFYYIKNIFDKSSEELYITFAYDDVNLWIGMCNTTEGSSEIFTQLKGAD